MQPANIEPGTGLDSSPEQAAQALLNLSCAVDHCHDAVLMTDRDGRIEFVNHSLEALIGFSASEVTGRNISSLTEGKSAIDHHNSIVEKVVAEGICRATMEIHSRHDGGVMLDFTVVAVRDRDGSIANLVYTGKDLTEERALQPELAQARDLQTVATLAGGAAHDFNNLLMVISAYAELALQTVYNEHPLRRNLQEILAAARRASDLTRELLMFGRKQANGCQPVQLNSVVEDASRMLSKLLGEDIEVKLSLQDNLRLVEANPGQLQQVLVNLAVNARDAMPHGGKIVVQTQAVSPEDIDRLNLPMHSARGFVLLAVTDSGLGIQAEHLPRIFDPFFTTKPEGKGTGLGLAMVNNIIRQSRGFIRVDSEINRGTRFRIWLPVASQSKADSHYFPSSEPEFVPAAGTLLVVEDDDAVRAATAEFLSTIGYRVLSAANGEEALHAIENHSGKIELMITDVVMPVMNGTKLASLASSKQPEIKVLFVSGYAASPLLRKGVKDLTAHFIGKPYSLQSLAAKIQDTLLEPVAARAAAAGAG